MPVYRTRKTPGVCSARWVLCTVLGGFSRFTRIRDPDAVNSGRIFGPTLYGTMYAVTVSFIPSAILWLSVGCAVTAFLVLAFVRLPDYSSDVRDAEQQGGDLAREENSELDPLLEPNDSDQGTVYL